LLEKNLETCLNNSFKYAHGEKHEFVTTEHLLLSLLDNEESIKVLSSCNIDTEILKVELLKFI
jgi:ATP-dependent Clp protease ATP-binding subunit ClpA